MHHVHCARQIHIAQVQIQTQVRIHIAQKQRRYIYMYKIGITLAKHAPRASQIHIAQVQIQTQTKYKHKCISHKSKVDICMRPFINCSQSYNTSWCMQTNICVLYMGGDASFIPLVEHRKASNPLLYMRKCFAMYHEQNGCKIGKQP